MTKGRSDGNEGVARGPPSAPDVWDPRTQTSASVAESDPSAPDV